jgi:hypothetical protein
MVTTRSLSRAAASVAAATSAAAADATASATAAADAAASVCNPKSLLAYSLAMEAADRFGIKLEKYSDLVSMPADKVDQWIAENDVLALVPLWGTAEHVAKKNRDARVLIAIKEAMKKASRSFFESHGRDCLFAVVQTGKALGGFWEGFDVDHVIESAESAIARCSTKADVIGPAIANLEALKVLRESYDDQKRQLIEAPGNDCRPYKRARLADDA